MEYKITDLLYQTWAGTVTDIIPNLAIGNTGLQGIGLADSHPQTGQQKAKASAVLLVLSEYMKHKTVSVGTIGTQPFFEVVSPASQSLDRARINTPLRGAVTVNQSNISVKVNRTEPTELRTPYYHLAALFSAGIIMCEPLRKVLSDIESRPMNQISSEDAYLFCDTFYYDFVKQMPAQISLNVGTEEEFLSAWDMGTISSVDGIHSCFSFPPRRRQQVRRMAEESADDSFFAEMKSGVYRIEYDWSQKARTLIQPLSFLDSFVPSDKFYTIARKFKTRLGKATEMINNGENADDILRDTNISILLFGKPGTGKSSIANAISAAFGLPVWVVPGNKYTEADTYEGMYKIRNGVPCFTATPFLDCAENGGILLFEEINLIDPNVLTAIGNQFLEYPYIIYKDGVERVKRHPLCCVMGTMNVGTEGSSAMNEALVSRMRQKYEIKDPPSDALVKVLVSSGHDRLMSEFVVSTYTKIIELLRSKSSTEDLVKMITIRSCMGALEDYEEGAEIKTALADAMANSLRLVDENLGEKALDVIDTMRDATGGVTL